MRTFEEHVTEASNAILSALDLCGNAERALSEYFADAGFPRVSPERDRVADAARKRAEAEWARARFR